MQLHHGDNITVLRNMDADSIDSIVTDPPYGISFMNKKWDYDVPSVELWKECMRVLKPGGHMLVACGTRTQHRMVVNIEDAGFEIRDVVTWLYGQGFPKATNCVKQAIKEGVACGCKTKSEHSLRPLQKENLPLTECVENKQREVLQSFMSEQSISPIRRKGTESKTCEGKQPSMERRELHRTGEGLCADQNAGASESETERICIGTHSSSREDVRQEVDQQGSGTSHKSQSCRQSTRESEGVQKSQGALDGSPFPRCSRCERPILPEGYFTALKPACEFFTLCRKPISEKTIAKNVVKHGTGALNIDGCRIGTDEKLSVKAHKRGRSVMVYESKPSAKSDIIFKEVPEFIQNPQGRWPANLILDEEAAEALDEQACQQKLGRSACNKVEKIVSDENSKSNMFGKNAHIKPGINSYSDSGGASRFFYVAKASKSERNKGCEGLEPRLNDFQRESSGLSTTTIDGVRQKGNCGKPNQNHHPTVKPIKLMEYLCKLVTPPNGTVLDPFTGSGSTGVAAKNLGFKFIGIEIDAEYVEIAKRRIEATHNQTAGFKQDA